MESCKVSCHIKYKKGLACACLNSCLHTLSHFLLFLKREVPVFFLYQMSVWLKFMCSHCSFVFYLLLLLFCEQIILYFVNFSLAVFHELPRQAEQKEKPKPSSSSL